MFVLGIESTCDETACAIVRDGKEILSHVVASQVSDHQRFNGVYPEVASRAHFEAIIPVIQKALAEAHVSKEAIDLIAVAHGPGLIGSLLLGLNVAKALSLAWEVPFVGVNHVEAHLYAAMMPLDNIPFPSLGVVISGGHTFLVKISGIGRYEMIGTTQDDAIGEAFDKVAALLDLPYPGGPSIEALAKQGDPSRFPFSAPKLKGRPWDFSFSGLKTNVLYTVKGANSTKKSVTIVSESDKADIAASFQEVALGEIIHKTLKAADMFGCQAIFLGGGVSNNKRLRGLFAEKKSTLPIYWPPVGLSLDNAAMIAGLGYHVYLGKGKGDDLSLEPMTRISLEKPGL